MTGTSYDVAVIGAGPGGSTLAAYLAGAGLSVVVVEGTHFPRWHIGESLLASSMGIFEEIGVLPQLERFHRKLGALWVWGPAPSLLRLEMPPPGYAYQVERAQFDQILVDNARELGAEVRMGCWARDPLWDGQGRMTGLLVQNVAEAPEPIQASFVVDASGLFQYLPKRLNLAMDLFGPQRAAVTGYFSGAALPDYPYTADVISEASRDGWMWFIPFADRGVGVGYVGDAMDMAGNPSQLLAKQIASTEMIRRLLAGAGQTRRARLLKYTNHIVASPLWDRGHVLVGDTAGFVDPLFSTGINATVYSASHAAAGLISVLRGEVQEREAAHWYDDRVRGHYRRTTEMTRLLYAAHPGQSRFWRSRDLSGMSGAEAEAMLARIGAGSLDLFRRGIADGGFSLPREVSARLPEFHTDPTPTAFPPDRRLALAPGVSLLETWARSAAGMVAATRAAHATRRTPEFDLREGGLGQLLVGAADGTRTLAQISALISANPTVQRKLGLLAGSLAQAGVIQTAPDEDDVRITEPSAPAPRR